MPSIDTIPYVSTSSITIPRVFIGDRGFLKRYGSRLTRREKSEIYRYAISRANFGLCSGDNETASILADIKMTDNISTIYHSRFLLSLAGNIRIQPGILAATLQDHYGCRLSEEFKANDTIISGFMNQAYHSQSLSKDDISSIEIDAKILASDLESIRTLEPTLVTVGGDWLDLALACGLDDVICTIITELHSVARSYNSSIIIFSYMYPVIPGFLSWLGMDIIKGLFCPVNLMGNGMPPDRDAALQSTKDIDKLKIGMHILGGGIIPILPALDYAINHINLDAVVIGASKKNNIDNLVKSTQRCFT